MIPDEQFKHLAHLLLQIEERQTYLESIIMNMMGDLLPHLPPEKYDSSSTNHCREQLEAHARDSEQKRIELRKFFGLE